MNFSASRQESHFLSDTHPRSQKHSLLLPTSHALWQTHRVASANLWVAEGVLSAQREFPGDSIRLCVCFDRSAGLAASLAPHPVNFQLPADRIR